MAEPQDWLDLHYKYRSEDISFWYTGGYYSGLVDQVYRPSLKDWEYDLVKVWYQGYADSLGDQGKDITKILKEIEKIDQEKI